MIKNNYEKIFSTARVLFTIRSCSHCRIWKFFIERENLKLKPEKRITIVDASLMNEFGIYNDSLLKIFDKYIQDFPIMFIEGKKLGRANSKEEAIAFLRTYLYDDYIIPRVELQTERCEYKIGFFGKKTLICGTGE